LLLVVAFVVVVALSSAKAENESVMNRFESWMTQFGKTYPNHAEKLRRYRNFMQSLLAIERLNNQRRNEEDAVFGLTKFADLSPIEFKNTVLMHNGIAPNRKHDNVLTPTIALADMPDYVDWYAKGAVTPVKNQEQCGSCWAFSATEAIESTNILAGKFTADNIDLAPQQIVDCDTSDDGCGGGEPMTAYEYVISAGGLESNTSYPYTAVNGVCHFKKAEVVTTISSWKYATQNHDESLLQQNLASYGPLSVCVDAARWQYYQSGVMTRFQCDIINLLDHCVQAVGFNSTASTPYYMVRNSWGFDWGLDGYIWLEMNHNTCGITDEVTWPSV